MQSYRVSRGLTRTTLPLRLDAVWSGCAGPAGIRARHRRIIREDTGRVPWRDAFGLTSAIPGTRQGSRRGGRRPRARGEAGARSGLGRAALFGSRKTGLRPPFRTPNPRSDAFPALKFGGPTRFFTLAALSAPWEEMHGRVPGRTTAERDALFGTRNSGCPDYSERCFPRKIGQALIHRVDAAPFSCFSRHTHLLCEWPRQDQIENRSPRGLF